MTTLEKYLVAHDLTYAEAARRMGLKYVHVWRHSTGRRPITAEYALRYERLLGIPRYELRPDLWPAPESKGEKEAGDVEE